MSRGVDLAVLAAHEGEVDLEEDGVPLLARHREVGGTARLGGSRYSWGDGGQHLVGRRRSARG